MSDRELLELAAKAAGIADGDVFWGMKHKKEWQPLTDDGDALRLAVKLGIDIEFEGENIVFADGNYSEFLPPDPVAATRRAIVRAAAEIGKAMT